MIKMILVVAAGGAFGAALRYMIGVWSTGTWGIHFPYGTLIANIVGCFVMGALIEVFALKYSPSMELRAFLMIGFLGALTTYSSYALDSFTLTKDASPLVSYGYMVGTPIMALTSFWLGMMVFRAVLKS